MVDDRTGGPFLRRLGLWAVEVVTLVAACCMSPSHVVGLRLPSDLFAAVDALTSPTRETLPFHSPFDPDYIAQFQESSAALSYFPLLALGRCPSS